ncbi:MbcA/ParS/Xre antitoxin family protein [Bradyrhizobium sp. LHD-71]|uniref:MbcA/ParS/Xre antitoxin family protein n=1 Tax=Bradyrhizobium sp. LHD-71 TaxID=3072141 RepID=UPI00280EC89F|nr:MbcA/ParS/Xre antitoxin family protein [Bradyrhizobium sp. LHD-71]MDQ8727454.1 MbcA/ParS/Xre antitoxin family protein [Bradyrhizobium sp. LHD-71]
MLQEIPRTHALPDVPQITASEAEAMARAVTRLFEKWQISDAEAREILGGLAARTYARWKAGELGRIDRDLATRLSLLMGIHKGLRYLFSDSERGYAWVKKSNRAFEGRTPVEIMAQGDIFSLARVRSYLDAERSGW